MFNLQPNVYLKKSEEMALVCTTRIHLLSTSLHMKIVLHVLSSKAQSFCFTTMNERSAFGTSFCTYFFFLEAFAIHLHAIFLQKIISVIIAIYSIIASNEEFCITIIQLLQVWIAMVSSWLIVQVNFMTFLGEKITHIYYAQPVKTYSGQTDPLILH